MRSVLIAGQLLGGLVLAFNQNQSPTFRSRIEIVRTDVTVIDNKTGKPLTGLTDRDFIVKEDGVQQAISTFVAESGEGSGNNSLTGDAANTQTRGRTFLIVLGAGTKEGTSDPYGGTARFVRSRLRPTDRAAVMVMDRVTPLTTDFETLAQIVERRKRMPTDVAALMRRDGLARDDFNHETHDAIDRWLLPSNAAPGFLRPVAPLVLGVPELNQIEGRTDRLSQRIVSSDLLKVAAGIEFLRYQPGEKRLVLISLIGLAIPVPLQSFVMLRTSSDAQSLATRAADAGVVLDLVTTYGTPYPPSLDWSNAIQGAQQIAAATGGEFTSLRTVEQQLARMDESSRFGYVIGYVPTNTSQDERRRQISIAVNRKDVTVIYRRAYSARPEAPVVDTRGLLTRERLEDAAMAAADFDDIRVDASASQVTEGGEAHVRFTMTVDVSKLSVPRDDKRIVTLDVMALCGDSHGATIGSRIQQLKINPDDEQLAAKSKVPFTMLVPIKGRPTRAKVIVYSYDQDRLGAVSLRVQ